MLSRLGLAVVLLATGVSARGADSAERVVRWSDDKATVKVTQAPLGDVLADLAKASGAELRGETPPDRKVDADFADLPTKQALERLLGDQSFTLTYEEGRLKVIDLRGGPTAASRTPSAATGAAVVAQYPEAWTTLWRLFEGRDAVPIDGKLKEFADRGDSVPWDYLTNTAYGAYDADIRRAAVQAGMTAFEADRDLRDGVISATDAMTDAELAEFARTICFHRAEDFVGNIARETSVARIRTRARGVLRELEARPYKGPIPHEMSQPPERPESGS